MFPYIYKNIETNGKKEEKSGVDKWELHLSECDTESKIEGNESYEYK